jgi:hypothetical protein
VFLSRVPGAMQRVALAKRCFAEPGPYQAPAFCTAPALQRTASQGLRAALRPGHAYAGNQPLIIGKKKIATLIAKPIPQRIDRSVGRSPR